MKRAVLAAAVALAALLAPVSPTFATSLPSFFEDPVFLPVVSITSDCNAETGQVEWTATGDNSGSNVIAQVVITVGDSEGSPTNIAEGASQNFSGTTTTGVTVTITMTSEYLEGTATESATFSETCDAFNPSVQVNVVCSLATGAVTWTASASNSTSTVVGTVVVTVGDSAQDAVEIAAGSSQSFSGDTASDVTVTITMTNTDFPDDTATASDVHEGDCTPVFEPTVTIEVTCTESTGTVNWSGTVSNSASTVAGSIQVTGADDVSLQSSSVAASGSRGLTGTTEVGVTITITASADGFDDVSASDMYEGTCDPPATTTTTTSTVPPTFPSTGADGPVTQGTTALTIGSIVTGIALAGIGAFARRRTIHDSEVTS